MDQATSADFTLGWLAASGVLCVLLFAGAASSRNGALHRAAALPLPLIASLLFGAAFALRFVPALALELHPDALVRYDMDSYRIVGDLLRSGSDIYSQPERYPYLPFHAYILAAAGWFSDSSGLPFLLLVKLPQITADAAIAVLLLVWPKMSFERRLTLAALYALNPATILIASIHGQFDSIPLFFLVLSLWVIQRSEASDRRALLAGLALGVAILSKTWPAFALPLLAWYAGGDWRQRAHFVAGAILAPAAGCLTYGAYLAWHGLSPEPAIRAVVGYSGVPDAWGYPLLLVHLHEGGVPGTLGLLRLLEHVDRLVLALAVAGATVIAVRRGLLPGMALVVLTFYALTPGWGTHWLVWAVPFVLLGASGSVALGYITLTSLTVGVAMYGYGGVDFALLEHFTLESRVMTYRWMLSLPIWSFCATLAVVFAAQPWFDRRCAEQELEEAVPVEVTVPASPGG